MPPPARPTRRRPSAPLLALALALACQATPGEPEGAGDEVLPTIEALVAGARSVDGLLPLHWDGERLLLEVVPDGRALLHVERLTEGLGSNDVGLDRGQLGERRLVEFRELGGKVLLVAPNLDWRSSSSEPDVRRAARESFAESVLFGFEPVARSGERVLVDATPFLLRDTHGVARALEAAGQGTFALEASRSAVDEDSLEGFPENSEVEVLLTFVTDAPGPEVRATAPDPLSVTLRLRHSFVALPDLATSPYRERAFHPRCGFFPHTWRDVSAPVDAPLEQRVITRHRLDPDTPIVYFVDRGAPEPVRTALLEGARYWEPVFAAAGLPGGFRAELMPEGADPHDVRHDVIQWVSRSTRGWSYGESLVDPRTGEILKGHVTLGALRVRQDVALFEGLLSPYAGGVERSPAVLEAALARIRQLAAHEVGHTLGLAHAFAASTDERASVMDYPAPRVAITPDGSLDLSRAYAPGAGSWDLLAIRYGYGRFEDEAEGLAGVLAEARAQGLVFLSDGDARGDDRAHPAANLWDDGADPLASLEHELEVRRIALERFSRAALRPGRPLFDLEAVLVPVYLHHRYQLEAAVRQIGGLRYEHLLRGEAGEDEPLVPVPEARQRHALELALVCLEPATLRLPEGLASRLVPPPPGSSRERESFQPGALLVDPRAVAEAGIEVVLAPLLHPARLARLADRHRADPAQLGPGELFDALAARFWSEGQDDDPDAALLRAQVRAAVTRRWMDLAEDPGAALDVRAAALDALHSRWAGAPQRTPQELFERERLRRWFEEPRPERATPEARVPPGAPIGASEGLDCGAPPGSR